MNTAMLLKPKGMVAYIYGDLSAEEGLKEFIEHGYTAVPVIDREGMYIGVVSERDFLYRILETKSVDTINDDNLTVAELASCSRFESVPIDADIDTLFNRIIEQNFVPVVDSRGMFSGIVTRKDVLMRMECKLRQAECAVSG
ncbi:MAG: CBS domain-containing protein [Oscillospiraceae bacterium]|nr:CBS domain-containing protein [Oscillospiraceae bacterium]